MARRIAMANLNARSIDIINTIRENASLAYQQNVPQINDDIDIPKVGEALYGYPAHANEFLNALINQIALIRIKSALFNNAYADLKKGYLEFGETVEEVFVSIAKAREFSAEKAEAREFKRTLPDVKSAFHLMNWRVQYPITVQQEDLRRAFTSADGVTDLIAQIIGSVMTAAEYDEYLLFKYLIIKGIAKGKLYPVAVDVTTDIKNAAKGFRGTSNALTFMATKYNETGVHTTTPKGDQYIFMDAQFNADYDVDVLASAFNMDKATFSGHLKLIDDFTTFDNERFDVIRAESDMIEEVTAAELALMADVVAVLVDQEWFQVYDNLTIMTDKQVASGVYWNYFYNVWKTVDTSPFSNAVVFVNSASSPISTPATLDFTVVSKVESDGHAILTFTPDETTVSEMYRSKYQFVQNQDCTTNGVAVQPYGALIYSDPTKTPDIELTLFGDSYVSAALDVSVTDVGDTVTFTKQ